MRGLPGCRGSNGRRSGQAQGLAAPACYREVQVSSPLNFHLEHYEGPLDLLLDLIRKQQIDIYDIPIATITSQYLEYHGKAREMDIDLGAEFVYMAATLIHIKSKMLLPRDPALAKEGDAGGRSAPGTGRPAARTRALQERRRDAAAEAHDRRERLVESADQGSSLVGGRRSRPGVTLFDLVKAFGECWNAPRTGRSTKWKQEDVTVPDMIRYLQRAVHRSRTRPAGVHPARVRAAAHPPRHDRLFLAVLELVKMQAVVVTQKDLFGEIALQRHSDFDAVFASGQPTPRSTQSKKITVNSNGRTGNQVRNGGYAGSERTAAGSTGCRRERARRRRRGRADGLPLEEPIHASGDRRRAAEGGARSHRLCHR